MLAVYSMRPDVKPTRCSRNARNRLTAMNGVINVDSMRITSKVVGNLSSAWPCEWRQPFSGGTSIMLSE